MGKTEGNLPPYLLPTPADAARRIEDWFRRGYVIFSDVVTRSTHLRPVPVECEGPARRAD
jgi:hypothetical protein